MRTAPDLVFNVEYNHAPPKGYPLVLKLWDTPAEGAHIMLPIHDSSTKTAYWRRVKALYVTLRAYSFDSAATEYAGDLVLELPR